MLIGNIVHNNPKKEYKNFNVVNALDKIIEGLPTLIIGWDIVKQINPDADFLNRKLSNNISCTFNLTERRDLHEEDLYYFIKNCYNNLISKVKYNYIDFLLFNDNKILEIFKILKENDKLITFHHGNMIYIYGDNNIYGIDLKVIKYIGRDVNKLIIYLKDLCEVFLSDNEILIEYKVHMDVLNNEIKYIPFLYSINNE